VRKIVGGILLVGLLLLAGQLVHSRESEVAYNPNNLIRLHVIANSDLDVDQELKYEVRDVILQEFRADFQGQRDPAEADRMINNSLDRIRQVAEDYLQGLGKDVPVTVDYGIFPFPVKAYGSLILPAGEYRAVRVILGTGQGANWWCVLFPPLCFVDVAQGVPDDASIEEVLRTVRDRGKETSSYKPEFRFKTLELLQNR
jgi:stage II sporulation protein R